MFDWIKKNKEWFFGGIGVFLITLLLSLGKYIFDNYEISSKNSNPNTSVSNIKRSYVGLGLSDQDLHGEILESFDSIKLPEPKQNISLKDTESEQVNVIQIGDESDPGNIYQGEITINPANDDNHFDIQHAPDDFILPSLQIVDKNRKRYRDLFYFMEQGDLAMANAESSEILLRSINLEPEDDYVNGWFSDLPCGVLISIDQIWRHYSDGEFGFAPQLAIKKDVMETDWARMTGEVEELVGDETGWIDEYGEWELFENTDYSFSAPRGHLPWFWNHFAYIHVTLNRYDQCANKYQL